MKVAYFLLGSGSVGVSEASSVRFQHFLSHPGKDNAGKQKKLKVRSLRLNLLEL
jgi:hypothetical protein